MEQLGDFVRLFAELIGIENKPRFVETQNQSTALLACTDSTRVDFASSRIYAAHNPANKENKSLVKIEQKMLAYGLRKAEVRDLKNNIIFYTITPENDATFFSADEQGEIEGEITGVRGADATMHIEIKEWSGRIVHIACKDIELSLEIAKHLRTGSVRLFVEGLWDRTDKGWKPNSEKCFIYAFEELNTHSIANVMNDIRNLPDMDWKTLSNPSAICHELREEALTE